MAENGNSPTSGRDINELQTFNREVEALSLQVQRLEQSLNLAKMEKKELESVIVRDRRKQKKMRARLAAQERDYAELFEHSEEALFFHEPQVGTILRVNSKVLELFGYSRNFLVGRTVGAMSQSESRIFSDAFALELIQRAAKDGRSKVDWLSSHCSGNSFWTEVNLRRARLKNKDIVLAAARDISDRVESHERIYALEMERRKLLDTSTMYRRLKLLTDGIPQVIFIADAEGKIVFWNHRFLEVSGLPLSVALTHRWQELIHPDDLAGFRREWMRCLASGATFEHAFRMRKVMQSIVMLNSEYRWYSMRAVSRRDDANRIVEWYGTLNEFDGSVL